MRTRLISIFAVLIFVFCLASVSKAGWSPKQATHVQKKLSALGYQCSETGKMDEATVEALKQFQKDHGLTVDGVCGPATMKALMTAYEAKTKGAEGKKGMEEMKGEGTKSMEQMKSTEEGAKKNIEGMGGMGRMGGVESTGESPAEEAGE